jgi:hypothetical protein
MHIQDRLDFADSSETDNLDEGFPVDVTSGFIPNPPTEDGPRGNRPRRRFQQQGVPPYTMAMPPEGVSFYLGPSSENVDITAGQNDEPDEEGVDSTRVCTITALRCHICHTNKYLPLTYNWTVPLILMDHSYLIGKLTSSKIADTKVSGF